MSNLRNRFLALAVVVVMLVAALGSTVSAATSYVDVTSSDDNKMIKLLSAIGIVKGTGDDADGNPVFDPDTPVTRQQMALFLARIHSATPGAFISDDSVKIPFTDVKDATYFLAIQYCVEQNIINGRSAEEFDPTATVTLDEALAMIVRALGYKDLDTSKNFIESTKKAKELGFALTYKDTEGKKELDRIEVMRLLYKYFYSDEQSLEIVKNEATGVQHTVRVPHPVMEKFGINVQEAYIVRADDYTASIGVTLETPYGDELTLPATAAPSLTAKEIADGKDIVLAYNNFKVVSTNVTGDLETASGLYTRKNGYTYSGKWTYIAVSRAEIGLTKDDKSRDNVGLKAIYYVDSLAATRPEALDVISYVKGTKTAIDIEDMSAKVKDDLKDFSDYANALTILDKTYDLRSSIRELTDADIYQYVDNTTNLKQNGSAKESKLLLELGGFISKKGNFGLEYVVNDTDADGNATEFYFIFTPYSVGYYVEDKRPGDSDDNKDTAYRRFLNGTGGEVSGNTTWYYQNPDSSTNIVLSYYSKDVSAIEKTNAYLYTREGKYLNIFAKLNKRVDSKYPDYIYSGSMSLSGNVITISDKNAKIAVGATTSTSNFGVGAKHSAFSLTATSDIFFVVRLEDVPSATSNRKYGVLTSAPTSVANYLGNGQYMYMYSVFTYADNRVMSMTSEILLTDYAYWQTRKLEAGDLVSYQKVGDYYRMGAFDADSYLYQDRNGHATYRFDGGTDGIARNTTSVIDGFSTGGWTYDAYTSNLLTVSGLTGIITSNTEILLTEYSDRTFKPEGFISGRKLTKAEFDKMAAETNPFGWYYTIEMVTEYETSISNALVVHVRAVYNPEYNNDMYATVYELLGSNDAYYSSVTTMAKAYNYLNGTEYLVAAASGSALKVGEVVRISPDRYSTVNNTTYWLVSRISTPPQPNAVASGVNRGYFSQPYTLKTTIESRLSNGITISDLIALLQSDSGSNPFFAYPIVTSTRGGAVYGASSTTSAVYTTNAAIRLYSRDVVHSTTGERVTLYAATPALLEEGTTANGLTPTSTGLTTQYASYTWAANGVQTIVNIDNAKVLTEAEKTLVDAESAHRYILVTGATTVYTRNDVGGNVVLVAKSYVQTGDPITTYNAISLLNRNKVNYITITLPASSYSNSSTLINYSATSANNTKVEFGRKDWDGIPVVTDTSGNPYMSNSSLRKYYVITNNTTETKYSDIVTIIEFKYAS